MSKAAAVLLHIKAQQEIQASAAARMVNIPLLILILGSAVNVKTLRPLPLCSLCQSCDLPEGELNGLGFMVGTEACFSRYTVGR